MKTILTAALICLMPLAAMARIGETLEQCIALYGKPVEESKERGEFTFVKDKIRIVCRMDGGKCWKVEYSMAEQDKFRTALPMDDATKKSILEIYGFKYNPAEAPVWKNDTLTATYTTLFNQLSVSVTSEMEKHRKRD